MIAIALAYIAYSIFTGAALDMPAPAGAVPTVPAVEMPWDAAGRQVSEAVEGATRVLMAGFVAIVLAIVAWVALKARGLWKMVRK
jgi:hypothetical protein